MNKPTIVLLCGRSPRHLYVANRLCAVANVVAIVQETGTPSLQRAKKLARPHLVARKAWRWLRDRRRYLTNRESTFFFPSAPPALNRPNLVVQVPTVNDFAVVSLVERHQPDIVAVFGTSLIRGPLLQLGRIGLLNLHGGLSPRYRGADCTFWALYNGEPDQVGCTIHFVDAGIDTGRLVAHVRPSVEPDDDELSLFWRAVRESAEVYAQAILRLSAGARIGVRQTEKGRLYQTKDRGLRHEVTLARHLARGLLDNTHLPLRIQWFVSESEPSTAEHALVDVT